MVGSSAQRVAAREGDNPAGQLVVEGVSKPNGIAVTSLRPVKGSSPKGGNHDADCSPHRSVPL